MATGESSGRSAEPSRPPRRPGPALLLAVGAAAAALACLANATAALRRVEEGSFDLRSRSVGGPRPRSFDDLIFIAVDRQTEEDLGKQQPLPRSLHGAFLARLHRAGPRVIAYDLAFTDRTDPAEDAALRRGLRRARPVLVSYAELGPSRQPIVVGREGGQRELGAVVGDPGLVSDSDGVVRRMKYGAYGFRSFAVAAAEMALGHPVSHSKFGSKGAWISFHGPPGSIHTASFSRALRGDLPDSAFRNKIVIVGQNDPLAGDVHGTPVSSGQMSGAEVQANQIATVLDDFPLRSVPGWANTLLIVLLAFVGPLAALALRPLRMAVVSVAALLVFLAAAAFAFHSGAVVAVAYPALGLMLGSGGSFGIKYLTEIRERRRMRQIFSRFVPEPVVQSAIDRTEADLRVGGTTLEATVMFSDIRGFTSFAEGRPSEEVVEVLNQYLSEMTAAIQKWGGTVVSYMGDGIMAVFGAPIPRPDHATRAVAAAREMVGERLQRVNAWLAERGIGQDFRMGVGLNTGEVVAGNVGSQDRLEFTALGDTTNLAARLEAMTKESGHSILIADTTRDQLDSDQPGLHCVGERPIRGREAVCTVWAVEQSDTTPDISTAPLA